MKKIKSGKLKVIFVALFSLAFFFSVNSTFSKPKSLSGYFLTKDGKIFRTTNLGSSWQEIKETYITYESLSKGNLIKQDYSLREEIDDIALTIFNGLGLVVKSTILKSCEIPIGNDNNYVKDLPRGIYILRYKKGKEIFFEKFVRF